MRKRFRPRWVRITRNRSGGGLLPDTRWSATQDIADRGVSCACVCAILWSCADDEPEPGRNAPVQARGAEDAAAHPAALLRVQGHLGLGDPVPDVLYGHHGAVQRGIQEQDQRGRVPAGGRLHRRRHILHRHRAQLPHYVRGARRRGSVRPQGDPHELPPLVVRHRPAVLSAVRRVQRVRPRRRGEL